MEASGIDAQPPQPARVDWESFYRDYRKPGYLPGFEIVNKLGGGMFGLVFKARKESIGKDYAVKFLKVDEETVRDAVMREIDNVGYFAQIDHPNLVSIEDKGVVNGIPYLVMSYAGEETLQKRLQSKEMDREASLHIFVQAARGVQALHAHSLVHFDLKPANIFLKGDVARVGDYGLSKLVSASRNSLSFGRGTPYYMAPEMLQRRGDARSDVYSLGVILYESLYGEVPFRGDSEWEVLRKHEHDEVAFPPGALPQDREVIERCLQKDPDARFQSAAELLRAMSAPVGLGESMMMGAPPPPPSPPPLPPPSPPSEVSSERVVAASGSTSADPPPLPAGASLASASSSAPVSGMPWREDERRRPRGVIASCIRGLFSLLDLLVQAVLLPVLAVGALAGGKADQLWRLPGRMLTLLMQLIGLVVVISVVVLVVVTVLAMLSA